MRLLLICIYVCVCLWCGNVYAVRVLFMHEDAPVGRQTTNIFDDNTRKDDLRQDLIMGEILMISSWKSSSYHHGTM